MRRLLLLLALALPCLEGIAQITSFPHNESFESSSPSWTGVQTSTSCNTNSNWNRDANGTSSRDTGPSAAQSGSYYIYTEASSPCYTTTAYKTKYTYSPIYDLGSKTSASVDFYYHRYGSALGPLYLEVSTDGSTWTSIWAITNTTSQNQWFQVTVSLNNYLTATTQLRFKGIILAGWSCDMALDNITVDATGSSGSPDLTIESPTGPNSAVAGNQISVSCSVKNSGTSTSPGSTMAYYISTDNSYDGGDSQLATDAVSSLLAGNSSYENASITIPSGISSGTYYILFRADYNNAVAESNENNNVGSKSISISSASSCTDGIQNGDETGIDCGGSCNPCPTCNDGVQNQGETGIDCGGPCAPCQTTGGSLWSQNGSSIYYNAGNVGVGISAPTEKLTVNGQVLAKEYKATLSYAWPDYVFGPEYNLRPLSDLDAYIQSNNHLPNIPSATEVKENGLQLVEMNAKLLEKVEELTLYLIQMNKDFNTLSKQYQIDIDKLQQEIVQLKRKEK